MANLDTPRLRPLAWWREGNPIYPKPDILTEEQYARAHAVGTVMLDGLLADLHPSYSGFGERIDTTITSLRTKHGIVTSVIPAEAPSERQEVMEQEAQRLRVGSVEARIAMAQAADIDPAELTILQANSLSKAGGRLWVPDTVPAPADWIPEGLVPTDGRPLLSVQRGQEAGAPGSAGLIAEAQRFGIAI